MLLYDTYVLQKYIDIFAGTLGFWLFGYAISANNGSKVLAEDQDFLFWFFRVNTLLLVCIYPYIIIPVGACAAGRLCMSIYKKYYID